MPPLSPAVSCQDIAPRVNYSYEVPSAPSGIVALKYMCSERVNNLSTLVLTTLAMWKGFELGIQIAVKHQSA